MTGRERTAHRVVTGAAQGQERCGRPVRIPHWITVKISIPVYVQTLDPGEWPGQQPTASAMSSATDPAAGPPADDATTGSGRSPAADRVGPTDGSSGGALPTVTAAVMSPDEAVAWFAELLEPLARLALERGVRLPVLVDALKLALVQAAADLPGESDAPASRSDSRLAVMTGVHRKDLRRIRTTGTTGRSKSLSIVGEVFARWRSSARFLTRRGEPRILLRQQDDSARPSFEELVRSVTRDVHPRPVLDEMLRLGIVESEGKAADRIRLVQAAYVPAGDQTEQMRLARDNLADHVAAIAGNLQGGGRRFLEQSVYSDELTEASARRFNLDTATVWQKVFDQLMPVLQALHEGDRHATEARDHRVRLGMYGLATRVLERN